MHARVTELAAAQIPRSHQHTLNAAQPIQVPVRNYADKNVKNTYYVEYLKFGFHLMKGVIYFNDTFAIDKVFCPKITEITEQHEMWLSL